MRIYKMTATFGKLEHETLTLEPGLNIISAPNEWGKSTWCAFLAAMLYGLDTRAKTTKNALADKERYAPWSGSPMAGRIDLNWNGRDITIERKTKRRVPLGDFVAYETASGLPVPELTAANCGAMLLGVEQTVFRRAGFIRHSDLPVTQDEALRRRLNALVTTGDESGAADRLAQNLRDLKNRCRYNRTGLLPQAEAERDGLEEKIGELESLEIQCKKLKMRLGEVKSWLQQLQNHQDALAYAAAEADAGRVAQAREARDQAEQLLSQQELACAKLPPQEEAEQKVRELRSFRDQWNDIQMESRLLPTEPVQPQQKPPFEGMTAEAAREMVEQDVKTYRAAERSKAAEVFFALAAVALIGAAVLAAAVDLLPAGAVLIGALALLIVGFVKRSARNKQLRTLEEKYKESDPEHWTDAIGEYEKAMIGYNALLAECKESRGDVEVRLMVLQKKRASLCGSQEPEVLLDFWQQAAAQWDACHAARRELLRCENHLQALSAMAKTVKPPAMEDSLTFSEAETARLLSDCAAEQQRLQNRLGQYQGRMEALGDVSALQTQLTQVKKRIAKLEDTYAALTIAQETLTEARLELQRRFAPRISQRAQELLSALTGGRYQRLTLGEDLSVRAGAGEEETLRDAIWRSDGTVDQLYLALRLAVAEELTPEAPLILDDALVRFDDIRMKAAVKLLKEMSEKKQVIVFTCQSREKETE